MNTQKIFNIEAEKEVLGSIINNNDSICNVIDIIEPSDFHITKHELIYSTIKKLYSNSKPIEVTTLVEALGSKLKEVGGVTYLTELIDTSISSQNIVHYAEIIKEKSNMRKLTRHLTEALESAKADETKSTEIIGELQNKLLNIKDASNDNGDISKGVEQVLEALQKRYENGGQIQGIKTKWDKIDNTINGLNKTDFIIIGARPSMGKTAFANNLCKNTSLINKAKVNMFSLEMSKQQLLERIMADVAATEMEHIKKGNLTEEEWKKVAQATGTIANSNLRIYDRIFTLNGIKAECKKTKLQRGLDVAVIDYLGLIQGVKGENRQNEISEISRQLKLMAKELDIAVIALAQLSRAPEQRADHRPILSDLRESGSIEQDADIIMFLYRDEYYNPDSEDKGVIECIIAKNRNGEIGTVKLTWMPKYQKIVNYSYMTPMKGKCKVFEN